MRRRDFIAAIGGAAHGTAALLISWPLAARAAERVRLLGVPRNSSEASPPVQSATRRIGLIGLAQGVLP
jgi:hypothetical protein